MPRRTNDPEERKAQQKRQAEFLEALSKRLVKARKTLGIKRPEWIRRYQVGASRFAMWENGNHMPDLNVLIQICNDHDISLDYLLRGIGDPPKAKEPVE